MRQAYTSTRAFLGTFLRGDRNRAVRRETMGMCHQREWTDGGGDGGGAGTDTGVSPDDTLTAVTDAVSEGGRSGGC